MIRLSRLLIAVMIICAASVAVYAQEIYQGEFIQSKYTLYKQPGVLTNTSVSNPANMPLPGKTEISFAFTADENKTAQVIVKKGEEETIGAALNIDAEEMTAKCIWHSDTAESSETVSICAGVTYSVTMQLDLEMGSFGAVLYEGCEKNKLIGCVLDKALGADILSGGLDGIEISGTISDLEIYRERIAGDKAAVSFYGQSASIGARLAGDIEAGSVIDAYAAAYDEDGRLAALKKQDGVFGGYDDYAEIIFPVGGLFKNTTQLSLFMFEHDSIKPIAKKGTANISEGDSVKTGAIAYTSFADAAAIPKGWAMQAWGGGTAPVYSTGTSESTGTFLKLDAVSTGYRGIRSATNVLPPEGISLSFKVKRSQDYAGNYARIIIIYFDQNGNWKDENGNGYTPTITNIKSLPCDTWKNGSIYISPDNYPAGAVKFQVGFCTAKDSSEEYGGYLCYDSLCADAPFTMECESKLCWYGKGEEVVYKPNSQWSARLDNIAEIEGTVYNSDGEEVERICADSDRVKAEGWRYTPQESGFYKVTFKLRTADNRIIGEDMGYKAYYDSSTKSNIYINKAAHSFYVTAFENKAVCKERNPLYGLSVGNYDGNYDLDIADKVGMSFVRLHSISWKDIEQEQGVRNWGVYDSLFEKIRSKKLDVIGNILWTPKWASPDSEGSNSDTWPHFAGYAPTDMQYLTDFINDLYDRYGDDVDTWEIYNEPHINGGSVFWHDSTENYVKMLKSAYETIKERSGGTDTIVMGGIGARRYLPFYRIFIEKGGWNYTDKLAMHGYDLDPWNYTNVNSQLGAEGEKGMVNTEAHMILFNTSSSDIYYTEKQLGLRMFKEYLRQIKYKTEKIAYFQPYDNSTQGEDLMILNSRLDSWSVVGAGLFRKKPSYEPRFAAGALNTLIAMSGSEISYRDEYKTGNVNIVKLKSDEEPLYIIWCDDLAKADADIDIASNARIVDWEGREISAQGFLPQADNVYFITNIGENAFSNLGSAQGHNVYDGQVLYSEYEMNKAVSAGPAIEASAGGLFDTDTGELKTDSTAVWNDLTYKSGTMSKTQLALSSDQDGIELVIRQDSTVAAGAKILLGVDTFANCIYSDVVEITAQLTQDGASITKTASPDIGGDIPSGSYSPKGEEVTGAKGFMSTSGGSTYYCLYIPITQLYPYLSQGKMNIGMRLTGQNAAGSTVTTYFLGSGDYSLYRPERFAVTEFGGLK